jgi:hypothetical protein
VQTIVTSQAVLGRHGPSEPFRIEAVIADDQVRLEDAIHAVRAGCEWPLQLGSVRREPPPDPSELELLRLFDPDRVFLGARPEA